MVSNTNCKLVNSMGQLKLSAKNWITKRTPLVQSSSIVAKFLGMMSTTTGWKYVVIDVQLNRNILSKLIWITYATTDDVDFLAIFDKNFFACVVCLLCCEFYFFFSFWHDRIDFICLLRQPATQFLVHCFDSRARCKLDVCGNATECCFTRHW